MDIPASNQIKTTVAWTKQFSTWYILEFWIRKILQSNLVKLMIHIMPSLFMPSLFFFRPSAMSFDPPIGLTIYQWDPVRQEYRLPETNDEESEYDDSDDEDFDFCTPEERAAYMKEVRENEAACIVIPQEIF